MIAHYKLKPAAKAQGFRVFLGTEVALIVAGIGRVAAAAATAYLQGFLHEGYDRAWINVGIGGHATYSVGELLLAHKIVDAASGQCWYPPMVIDPPCRTAEVLTVDTPEESYPKAMIYEMEAAAFYPTACRFSTSELVHSLKIISDNRDSPVSELTSARVEALVEHQLEGILSVIEQTKAFAREIVTLESDPVNFETVLERWHFTVSERHRLWQLLRQYQVLYPDGNDWLETLQARRGRDVLRWLETRIAASPVRIT